MKYIYMYIHVGYFSHLLDVQLTESFLTLFSTVVAMEEKAHSYNLIEYLI